MHVGARFCRALTYDRAVPGLLRRLRGSSVDDERAMLRYAQESAALQLEAMKHELAERVQAVRERERALEDALLATPGQAPVSLPPVAEDAVEIAQRERALTAREEMLARREEELAQKGSLPADASERERIEQRLADLREAEKLFLVTQAELASRSEAIAARERLIAGREHAAGDGDHADRSELTELEARLRRLERAGTSAPGEDTASFAGGLESLRRRGTRRQA
jgi:hypothetical protein